MSSDPSQRQADGGPTSGRRWLRLTGSALWMNQIVCYVSHSLHACVHCINDYPRNRLSEYSRCPIHTQACCGQSVKVILKLDVLDEEST